VVYSSRLMTVHYKKGTNTSAFVFELFFSSCLFQLYSKWSISNRFIELLSLSHCKRRSITNSSYVSYIIRNLQEDEKKRERKRLVRAISFCEPIK